mgnify:CR=1 FL=1
MALVWIPSLLRDLAGGRECVPIDVSTVGEIMGVLEKTYPGVRQRLCQGDQLRPGLAVVVDGQIARLGLLEAVGPFTEVHFLPAIGGG